MNPERFGVAIAIRTVTIEFGRLEKKEGNKLLRISYVTNPKATTLKLEGKLSGPWVDEVARTWFDINGEKPAKEVNVDLAGVTYVDSDGKKLLGWMFQQGARLRNGHLMTRYIVDQVMRETARPQSH